MSETDWFSSRPAGVYGAPARAHPQGPAPRLRRPALWPGRVRELCGGALPARVDAREARNGHLRVAGISVTVAWAARVLLERSEQIALRGNGFDAFRDNRQASKVRAAVRPLPRGESAHVPPVSRSSEFFCQLAQALHQGEPIAFVTDDPMPDGIRIGRCYQASSYAFDSTKAFADSGGAAPLLAARRVVQPARRHACHRWYGEARHAVRLRSVRRSAREFRCAGPSHPQRPLHASR